MVLFREGKPRPVTLRAVVSVSMDETFTFNYGCPQYDLSPEEKIMAEKVIVTRIDRVLSEARYLAAKENARGKLTNS